MQRSLKNIHYFSGIWVKKSTIQKKINWLIRIPKMTEFHDFNLEIIAKYVTVSQSRLDNLSTTLLYFTGSEQNTLSL